MKYIDTIHELTLGVQKVYKASSQITENECGFDIYYNKSQISFYVLKNYDNAENIILRKYSSFNKVVVFSDKELKFDKLQIEKSFSNANSDNLVIRKNLSSKQLSQIRRAKNFIERERIEIKPAHAIDVMALTEKWIQQKYEDEKLYRITFSPNRYKNAIAFMSDLNYNFYNVFIDSSLYSSIAFYNGGGSVSYQLTYVADYSVPKIVNDQNELILWSAISDRFDNGASVVSLGTSGGIKGLALFKKKFYTDTQSCFSCKITKQKPKGLFG